MNHPHAARLNDFADELLPPAERQPVAEHLLVCDACRGRVDALRALASELAGLPREVAPSRDLRPAMPVEEPALGSDRITRVTLAGGAADSTGEKVTRVTRTAGGSGAAAQASTAEKVTAVTFGESAAARRRTGWLRAAAVVALVAGAAALTRALTQSTGDSAPPPSAQTALPAAPYAAADTELRAYLADRRVMLHPDALRALDQSLASVDRAIVELEAARASDPSDNDLADLLATQYRTRMELLRGAAALVAEGA